MPFTSLDDVKKEEEEDKKATTSYVGGEKSGLAVQNPGDAADAEQWKRMQEVAGRSSASGPIPQNHVTVTVYRNGFQVGEGPFRPLTDPINKKFMDEMSQGRCPSELQQGDDAVHVALHDKRSEDYKEPPPPAYNLFAGEGNTLTSSSSAAAAAPVQSDAASVAVNADKPKARVQIRFHDGSKKAQEFNEDHTIGDLRAFCSQCAGGVAMTVMGGFPPKPLTDDAQTLKDAGLMGAAVTARPA